MTSHFVLETQHTAIHAVLVSATATLPAVSITRLWIRNLHNMNSVAVASVWTVRTIQPETDATHA